MEEGRRTPWRAIALAVAVLVVALGGGVTYLAQRSGEERFCYAAQGFSVLEDGRTVLHQAGGPRPDCQGPETIEGELVLGVDCKVRADDGAVVTTLPAGSPGCG